MGELETLVVTLFIVMLLVYGLYCLVKKAVKDGIREYETEQNTLNDREREKEKWHRS